MFHVIETVLVLLELLPVQPVIREQLTMATRLSVVGRRYYLGGVSIIKALCIKISSIIQ